MGFFFAADSALHISPTLDMASLWVMPSETSSSRWSAMNRKYAESGLDGAFSSFLNLLFFRVFTLCSSLAFWNVAYSLVVLYLSIFFLYLAMAVSYFVWKGSFCLLLMAPHISLNFLATSPILEPSGMDFVTLSRTEFCHVKYAESGRTGAFSSLRPLTILELCTKRVALSFF